MSVKLVAEGLVVDFFCMCYADLDKLVEISNKRNKYLSNKAKMNAL